MAKKLNDRGRYARLFHDVVNTPAWVALGSNAKTLYIDLLIQFNGSNNGNLTAALGVLKHRGWRSPTTLSIALAELLALGFIVKTRGGGVRQGSRVCSLYALTDLPIPANPKLGIEAALPSCGFRLYGSLADAKKALAAVRGKKSTLQKLYPTATDSVAVEPVSDTDSVAVNGATTTETVAGRRRRNRSESRARQGFP